VEINLDLLRRVTLINEGFFDNTMDFTQNVGKKRKIIRV